MSVIARRSAYFVVDRVIYAPAGQELTVIKSVSFTLQPGEVQQAYARMLGSRSAAVALAGSVSARSRETAAGLFAGPA